MNLLIHQGYGPSKFHTIILTMREKLFVRVVEVTHRLGPKTYPMVWWTSHHFPPFPPTNHFTSHQTLLFHVVDSTVHWYLVKRLVKPRLLFAITLTTEFAWFD